MSSSASRAPLATVGSPPRTWPTACARPASACWTCASATGFGATSKPTPACSTCSTPRKIRSRSVIFGRRSAAASTSERAANCRGVRRQAMLRTERALLLGAVVALSCFACGDDKPAPRHQAPGEGVLPSAGKSSSSDDDDDDDDQSPAGVAGAPADVEAGEGGAASVVAGDSGVADAGEPLKPDDGLEIGTELVLEVSATTPTFV